MRYSPSKKEKALSRKAAKNAKKTGSILLGVLGGFAR
jgi:hypothetical protein